MKYFKHLGIYKASNVTFDPDTREAYSYGWWRFTQMHNGLLIFNNYSYSSSTCKHQSKVMRLLDYKYDLCLHAPKGLQSDTIENIGLANIKELVEQGNAELAKRPNKAQTLKRIDRAKALYHQAIVINQKLDLKQDIHAMIKHNGSIILELAF